MKSTLIEKNAKKEQEYPFLGVADDHTVVLFTEEAQGTVVRVGTDDVNWLGEWYTEWNMDCFTPFEGSVLLEN